MKARPPFASAVLVVMLGIGSAVTNAQMLTLPARSVGALSGSAFGASINALPRADREEAVAREVLAGNIPEFLRVLVPVRVSGLVQGSLKILTIHVLPDYVAVGADSDYFLIPMSPILAQRIADSCGCVLPTKKMVDSIYVAAAVKLAPRPIAPSGAMITVPVFLAHNDSVRLQRWPLLGVFPQGRLVGGTKKDVIISNKIYTALKPNVPKPVVIYGWHQLNGSPIQPVYNGHEETYADYSHGIRLVRDSVSVDGTVMTVSAVLSDPVLSSLLSDEGVIAVPRYGGPKTSSGQGQYVLPGEFMLEQNYPNPFNPTTTIAYAVPAAGSMGSGASEVRLAVYDLLGREVAVLLNENMPPGVHAVAFSAESLPSGVYYYTLRTPGGALTRSMCLIR
jgi:hypothetical protein